MFCTVRTHVCTVVKSICMNGLLLYEWGTNLLHTFPVIRLMIFEYFEYARHFTE